MGVAAYNRGSLAISRGLGFDREATYKPQPRPDGWGSKTAGKATKAAGGMLKYLSGRGPIPTEEDLAEMVMMNIGCGKETARKAARAALAAELNQ